MSAHDGLAFVAVLAVILAAFFLVGRVRKRDRSKPDQDAGKDGG